MSVHYVDIVYHSKIGCLESNNMRKLRVVKESWKRKNRHEIGMKKTKAKLLKLSETYNTLVMQYKLDRIEGNDIVKLLEMELNGNKLPNEIHVTGRIAEKILSSDIVKEHDRYIDGNTGEVTIVRGIQILKKNDTFKEMRDEGIKKRMRINPTGREQWLREIKFIYEE